MKKVITYGTFDKLHYGHIQLLKRAKSLGDYLVVGVTSTDFDVARGKINVINSLTDRINAVQELGIADEIIVEEYEGQKIFDIKSMDIDIFTVGSDWIGKFDYLKEFCEVIYLPRTEGISSTDIRNDKLINIGIIGTNKATDKVIKEVEFVDGMSVSKIYGKYTDNSLLGPMYYTEEIEEVIDKSDAIYIRTEPELHYEQIKHVLKKKKHVLCESPISISTKQQNELRCIARDNNLILMDAIKTAYAKAYERMLLLLKSNYIGEIVSVEATCTRIKERESKNK